VERFVVLESAEEILPSHLPDWMVGRVERQPADAHNGFALPAEGVSLEDLERDLIRQALDRTHHNKAQAAKLLGLTYDALRYQVKKYGME
jgi:DNA-binding NtrC family response regulator